MKKKFILGMLSAVLVLEAPVAQANKEDAGQIIGGIIGGIIGSKVGKGNGKTAAIIIGAIVGSVVGQEIGKDLDEADRRAYEEAQRRALENQVGMTYEWDGGSYGSRTGARGSFSTSREGYNYATGEYCREYYSVIRYRNRTEETRGVACTRRDGSWYEVQVKEVNFNPGAGRHRPPRYPENPRQPELPRPLPPSTPNYPDYGRYDDLRGYCPDDRHQDILMAKDFAYSSNGLNYNSNEAIRWALEYNNTHRCGTIQEFKNRFEILYDFAYSGNGLNMNSAEARSYALARVEYTSSQAARELSELTKAIRDFAYSGNGLNLNSQQAQSVARAWGDQNCEGRGHIAYLSSEYSRQYSFAYSGSGLNMNHRAARQYAVDKISRLTRCGDILRRAVY